MSKNFDSIIDTIANMSVLDLAELVKTLETKFGVSASSMSAPASATVSAEAAAPVDEKSEYAVLLKEVGADKIQVIKAVRQILPTLGLGDAKKLVDGAPVNIVDAVSKDEAKKMKDILEAAGAKVELV